MKTLKRQFVIIDNNWLRLKLTESILNEANGKTNKKQILLENDEIKISFRSTDIANLFLKIITHTQENYFYTIIDVLHDMENWEFKYIRSVNPTYDSHLKDRFTDLDLLEKHIMLYEHTENVIDEAIELTKDLEFGIKSIVIFLALIHDFGKADKVSNVVAFKQGERHDVLSAKYMRLKLKQNMETDSIEKDHIIALYNILSNHHSKEGREINYIANIFYQADINARKKEVKKAKEKEGL